jgi:type IX secretion system PorP/SprF family membrane protein
MKNNLALIVILLLAFQSVKAQQEPQYNFFFNNQAVFNPAALAAEQNTNAAINIRKMDVSGSPINVTLTGDHFIKSINTALGLTTLYQGSQYEKIYTVRLAACYRIKVNEKSFFQIGADGGIRQINFDYRNFNPPYGQLNKTMPMLSAGALFQSKRFTTSFSSTQILQNEFQSVNDSGYHLSYKESAHFYFFLQYRQPLGTNFSLRTSLLSITKNACCTFFDGNISGYYRNRAFLGAGFHLDLFNQHSGVSIVGGARVWKLWLQVSYYNDYNPTIEAMIRYAVPLNTPN